MEYGVEPTLESATAADLTAVVRLLAENKLPVEDVQDHLPAFVLAKWKGGVIGAVGLEHYGEAALLRSLCVAEPHRRHRVGLVLLSAIEARAIAQGVRELYLLTTGAAPYFGRHGFATIARDWAPVEIRGTAEFRALCPSAATCMRKDLRSPPERI